MVRNVATANPKLLRETQKSQVDINEDDRSASLSFFADIDSFESTSMSVMGYPGQATAYNDTSGRYSLRSQKKDRLSHSRALPFCSLDYVPSFVVDDHRVCHFLAIFNEYVPGNMSESYRTRKVKLSYFLEDNTIEIIEPKVHNSGLFQGKQMRRHQVQKPITAQSSEDGNGNPEVSIYNIIDLKAGAEVVCQGRSYTVIDCDEYTKGLFREYGEDFGKPQALPATYFNPSHKKHASSSKKQNGGFNRNSSDFNETKSFYEADDTVLRFFGVWDDTTSLFGIQNYVRIHYFLSDCTVEILQDFAMNDGRDRVNKFLKRMKVNKQSNGQDFETPSLAYTMENVMQPEDIYTWTDFHIGSFIHIVGANIQILDADASTKAFYARKGIDLGPAITLSTESPSKVDRLIPPYNGFGSEEDSLQTCLNKINPSPPRKDIQKLKKFAGQVLRFKAKLTSRKESDLNRIFVVLMYMEDDTLQIREPPVRNSGFWGGMFMARCKVKNPNSNEFIRPSDLRVDVTLVIAAHSFHLIECDEFSLKYMESRPDIWPECSLNSIVQKLQDTGGGVITRYALTLPGGPLTQLSYGDVERLVQRANIDLTKQEMVTLMRGLDPQKQAYVKLSKLLSILQNEFSSSSSVDY